MTFRPLQDRVAIKRQDAEEKTAGGIIIPENAKDKPQRGEVVAVSRGRRMDDGSIEPPLVKPGDKILFGKYSGVEIEIDGQELLIMREEDILGILEGMEI